MTTAEPDGKTACDPVTMLFHYASGSRIWWNWQTRYFEVVVGQPVQVQVLLCAPSSTFRAAKTFVKHGLSISRLALILLGLSPWSTAAQTVLWTTNYYSVTGASFREIRQSIAAARPWKDPFDGITKWTVNWKFTLRDGPRGCSLSSLATTTTITTTLPRWNTPPDVTADLKQQWSRYFVALAAHEAGHARIALAAADEVRRRGPTLGTRDSCEGLTQAINHELGKVLDDYRGREKEYDRRTEHGTRPASR